MSDLLLALLGESGVVLTVVFAFLGLAAGIMWLDRHDDKKRGR